MPKRVSGRKGKGVESEQLKKEGSDESSELEHEGSADAEPKAFVKSSRRESLSTRARRAFNLGRQLTDAELEAIYGKEEGEEVPGEEEAQDAEDFYEGEPEEEREEERVEELEGVEEDPDALLARLHQENKENFDKYVRVSADLENHKKRVARERADLIRYSGEHLARDLVDVIDDLERALAQDLSSGAEDVLAGVRMIYERFLTVLTKHSIRGEDALGKQFDPNKHEALVSVPSADHEAGTIIEQLKRPYLFKDKLLRPGQVVVAAAVERKDESEETEDD